MHGSTPSTDAAKDSHGVLQESKSPRAFFALFAIVILAAVAIPSIRLLDSILLTGLLIFSVCPLGVALLVRKPRDVINFPLFATVILFLRLGLGVNISKAILLDQQINEPVSIVAQIFRSWYAAFAWCGIAIILAAVGFKLSKAITRAAAARLADSAHDDLLARFYRASGAIGKLLAADTAAWLVITVAGSVAAAVLSAMNASQQAAPGLAAANSILTAVPLLMLLLSFAILMNKNFAHNPAQAESHATRQASQPIPVESSVIDQQAIDDFDHQIESGKDFDLSNSHLPQDQDFQPPADEPSGNTVAKFFTVHDYYEPIATEIFACPKSVTIFAGQSKDFLPVTVPVNVAIKLAAMKKRCLVIDNDFNRNAVSAVFDLDCHTNAGKAVLTDHDFWVSPADEKVPLAKKIKNAARAFDHVLVYSPSPFVQDLSQLRSEAPQAAKLTITLGPVGPLSALLDTLEDVGFKIVYDADLIKKAI